MTKSAKWRDPSEFGEPTWRYRSLLQVLMKIDRGHTLYESEMESACSLFVNSLRNGILAADLRLETLGIIREFSLMAKQYKRKFEKMRTGSRLNGFKACKQIKLDSSQRINRELDGLAMQIYILTGLF